MRKVLLIVIGLFIPMLSFAKITLYNHTDAYGTAKLGANGACSSSFGSMGIVKPHAQMTLTDQQLKFLCGSKICNAFLYPNDKCANNSIATVTFSKDKGIMNIDNYDKNFRVTGEGSEIFVDSVTSLFNRVLQFLM